MKPCPLCGMVHPIVEVVLPERLYLVELIEQGGSKQKTVVRYVGINSDDGGASFEGYEAFGSPDYMHVIREVMTG